MLQNATLDILERTPAVLSAFLRGTSASWHGVNEGPDTWSPYDVVGHLIHGERTDWITRARIILAQGPDRRFEPYDRFAQVRESAGKTLSDLLVEFADLRKKNLATLRGWNLTDREFALMGEHPELGEPGVRHHAAAGVPVHGHFHPKGKAPSEFTKEVLRKAKASLPFADTRDFEEQERGLIARHIPHDDRRSVVLSVTDGETCPR